MKIKLVKISEGEINAIRDIALRENKTESQINEILDANVNQTLMVLRSIKSIYEWDDIEDMVNYVAILKKVDSKSNAVDLEDNEIDLINKVMRKSVETKKISGMALEKFVEVYETFRS